jgi:TPR repeat protein
VEIAGETKEALMRQNAEEIVEFERAAVAGRVDAQYELGLLYSTGHGTQPDYIAAHMWLNIASAKGNADARRVRAELAGDMSRDQIAEAQRRAREWLARH